jgi:hypothetical protein
MKTKKVIAIILAMLVCVVALCSCSSQNKETTPSTSDEIVLPNSPTDGTVPSVPGEENATGLVAGNADVKVVKYDKALLENLETPEQVGACVFSILTTEDTKDASSENIKDGKALANIMKKYSNVVESSNFDILYNDETCELQYSVCGFATTYSFSTKIEMYSVISPLFDKNIAYLIKDIKYDKVDDTMYIFLTEGWPYYEEAHTEEDENTLKYGIGQATGATQIFFNEINNDLRPAHYVIVMPDPNEVKE